MIKSKLPKLDLQLFGLFDEGMAPEGDNPILGDETPEAPESGSDYEGEQSLGQEGEVIATDPTRATTVTPKAEETKSFDFGDIQSKLDTIMSKMNQPADVQEEVKDIQEELTPEDIERMNNDFYMKFTEKPLEALEELINQRAEEKMQPMKEYFDNVQKMQYWNDEISSFEKAHPDFNEYIEEVSKIIQSDESIRNSKNPLELAYKVVKADVLESKVRPIDEQLKDEGVLREILGNKDLKNMIIKELKLTKEESPRVIGKDGKTSVNIEEKPRSISDGTKAWLNS